MNLLKFYNINEGFDFQGIADEFNNKQDELENNNGLNTDVEYNNIDLIFSDINEILVVIKKFLNDHSDKFKNIKNSFFGNFRIDDSSTDNIKLYFSLKNDIILYIYIYINSDDITYFILKTVSVNKKYESFINNFRKLMELNGFSYKEKNICNYTYISLKGIKYGKISLYEVNNILSFITEYIAN